MKFPFIEIEGTPYELGFQHGAAFKPQVQRSIACYREMFLDYSDLTWERAKELSRRFIPMIEAGNYSEFPVVMMFEGMLTTGSAMTYDQFVAANGVY